MNQKRLDRINELARKQKTIGLTDEEKAEQKKLREEYLVDFRKTLRGQLENISFVEADGSITPLSSLRKKDI
jgi:5-formyltetrahydrofolate cyclo-ligase